MGYRIGTRVLEMLIWRNENTSKTPKREIRLLPVLLMVQSQVWKAIFGKPADGLEKSSANVDECLSPSVENKTKQLIASSSFHRYDH